MSYDDGEEAFTEEMAQDLGERLQNVGIHQLSGHEQIQLVDIVECVGLVERQRRSLDENGARFMLFFRQHALRKGRTNEIHLSWREINWAYHSTSQDILVDFISKQHHGTLLWADARESGMFMWLTDISAVVRLQFSHPFSSRRALSLLTIHAESSVRDHCSERVYQERNEESSRLQSILPSSQEESRTPGSMAHGYLEP